MLDKVKSSVRASFVIAYREKTEGDVKLLTSVGRGLCRLPKDSTIH